jgi:uncharacterized protein YlxP (DUF503 family)
MGFFIGVERFRLDIPDCMSLKDKRRYIKSIIDRLGSGRLNCACEAGAHEYLKSGVLAFACVSPSYGMAEKMLDKAGRTIESTGVNVNFSERWVFSPEDLAGG